MKSNLAVDLNGNTLSLVDAGVLFKLDPALDEDDQELRLIYLSERMRDWLRDALPELGSTWNIETSPAEQLDALVQIFAAGETLTFSWQFKPLNRSEAVSGS